MTRNDPIHDPQRLAQIMDEQGLDALIASSFRHAFYLSDFYVDPAGMGDDFEGTCTLDPARRIAAVFRDPSIDPFLVLPTETAPDNALERQSWITDVRTHGPLMDTGSGCGPHGEDAWTVVLDALADRAIARGRIGVEISKTGLNLQTIDEPSLARLRRALPDVEWVDASSAFSRLRLVKTPEEIARLAFVQGAVDHAARAALERAREGMTEIALDRLFRHALVDEGVDHRLTQVTFAPDKWRRTEAWFPTDEILRAGNVVNFDVSARYRMYLSDAGLTAVCGEPSAEVRRVWSAVRAAYDAVRKSIRPGALTADLYRRALDVLTDAHLPPCIEIAGHGVGLSIHEPPDLALHHETVLQPGMVITDEILVHRPDLGIFQTEDLFLVTEESCRALSTVGGELYVIC